MNRYQAVYQGAVQPFAQVLPEDDLLHTAPADAPFTRIETNLFGFNIPAKAINCNIYMLWHPVFGCMSAHVFVAKGERFLSHQLECDYFNEHLYLPAAPDNASYVLKMGSCTAMLRVEAPLERHHIVFDDPVEGFRLDLLMTAALPPVGRPGGKHFTQLMRTTGSLTLGGETHAIDGHYIRDRSWGYERPEHAEPAPPYRWMTGWNERGDGFVVAWLDTAVLPGYEDWAKADPARGGNKWEHGGATPSLTLRSGWVSQAGAIRPVAELRVSGESDARDPFLTRAITLAMTDDRGVSHEVVGTVRQMIPKMYWGTMLTYMQAAELTFDGAPGHGDLMDTFSAEHFRRRLELARA